MKLEKRNMKRSFFWVVCSFFFCCCKVTALCSAGGEKNLILLDRTIHKPNPTGTVGWAGSTFGPLHKSRIGEHEFEALMRTLDNLVGCIYTWFTCGRPCHLTSFRQCSGDLIFRLEQLSLYSCTSSILLMSKVWVQISSPKPQSAPLNCCLWASVAASSP